MKPSNVMLRAAAGEVHATLIDFGVATRATEREGSAVGSPRFMAPEQRTGAIDPRADLFSCAAVVVYALSGQSPLDTDAEPSVDAIPAALAAIDVPEAMKTALRKALAIDPSERFASAAALRDALA